MAASSLFIGALLLAAASGQAVFSSSNICYTKSLSFGVCVEPGKCQVLGDGSSRCSTDQVCCKRDQVQRTAPTTTTTTTTPPPPVQLVADCGLAHPNTFLLRSRRRRSLTSPAEYGAEYGTGTGRRAVFDETSESSVHSDAVETAAAEGETTTASSATTGEDTFHSDIVDLLVTGGTDKPSVENGEATTPSSSSDAFLVGDGETTTLFTDSEESLVTETTSKPSNTEHTNAHGGFEHSEGYSDKKHMNGHTGVEHMKKHSRVRHMKEHTGVEHTNGHTGVEHMHEHSVVEVTDTTPVVDSETTTPLTDTLEPSVVDGVNQLSTTEGTDTTSSTYPRKTADTTEADTLSAVIETEQPLYVDGSEKTPQVSETDQSSIAEGTDKPTGTFSEVTETDVNSVTKEAIKSSVEPTTDSFPSTYSASQTPIFDTTTPSSQTTYSPSSDSTTPTTSSPSTPAPEATSTSPDTPVSEQPVVTVAEPATVGRWPWIALLGEAAPYNASTRWFCGGTLIAPSTVLTAAHCVADRNPTRLTVRLGEYDLSKNGDGRLVEVDVVSVAVHPEYRASQDDIAILRLGRPVTFNTRVRPVCLPTAGADLTGAEADLAGWRQLEHADALPQRLQQARLHVMDETECEEKYRGSEEFDTSFPGGFRGTKLCAVGRDGTSRDACQGDSGGPLVVREESGRYQVVGVVSKGLGCVIPRFPAVYTKVSKYIQWIVDNSE